MEHLVEWRSVLGESGAQCVMTTGITTMQVLPVDNLDLIQKVNHFVNDSDRQTSLFKQKAEASDLYFCSYTPRSELKNDNITMSRRSNGQVH